MTDEGQLLMAGAYPQLLMSLLRSRRNLRRKNRTRLGLPSVSVGRKQQLTLPLRGQSSQKK
eukprot:2480573-Prorocentrum_lima.AAC.1